MDEYWRRVFEEAEQRELSHRNRQADMDRFWRRVFEAAERGEPAPGLERLQYRQREAIERMEREYAEQERLRLYPGYHYTPSSPEDEARKLEWWANLPQDERENIQREQIGEAPPAFGFPHVGRTGGKWLGWEIHPFPSFQVARGIHTMYAGNRWAFVNVYGVLRPEVVSAKYRVAVREGEPPQEQSSLFVEGIRGGFSYGVRFGPPQPSPTEVDYGWANVEATRPLEQISYRWGLIELEATSKFSRVMQVVVYVRKEKIDANKTGVAGAGAGGVSSKERARQATRRRRH